MDARIGLQLYSVKEILKQDFKGTMSQIAEMGYPAVETAGVYGSSCIEAAQLCKDL